MKASATIDAATLSSLVIEKGETEVTDAEVTVAANGIHITIYIPGAAPMDSYTVTVPKGCVANSGVITADEFSQTVTIPRSEKLCLKGNPTYTKGTNSITISDLSVTNESLLPTSGWLVVGVYNADGVMIGIKGETFTYVVSGADSEISTVSLGTNSADDIAVVKAMLWDSSSTLEPYHDCVEVTLSNNMTPNTVTENLN